MLEINNIYKRFGALELFRDFSIRFEEGTITCILGPSGCGKTTLLNIIGGLVPPDRGELTGIEGRRCSYIFQQARLLPWKSVLGNISFVADRHLTAHEREELAQRLIRLVGLEGFEHYYPAQLSGGMRQRVSIARAFAAPSDIILMDEPLKGLDPALKRGMIRWFTQLWKADPRTVVFVTHDVEEALLLGNEIVVLSRPPATIISRVKMPVAPDERLSVNHPSDEPVDNESIKAIRTALEDALGLNQIHFHRKDAKTQRKN